ncbi:ABC transporter substrate-binding protein [Conexibacter sp. JD483]|uniref:ABC transporter substrate-binding protein n=1 Tax=unclassified Conexibacter TaxID=2627773 RepID=UPI00271BBE92|nr:MULTISPECIES: ABC transporter substrate-binding protein [unclassified Conexibacter]MDO8187650.1 ABC transporter substrate-binding protein [Conexibacter sp. CPCC 205706]MDO8199835.1 ABC transporter substrate-binding protein [Conexibacter sp. CPCC 205762]MDR9370212.1 ABC transporter substrate-binding protein [Conexibacter sp. JD483]
MQLRNRSFDSKRSLSAPSRPVRRARRSAVALVGVALVAATAAGCGSSVPSGAAGGEGGGSQTLDIAYNTGLTNIDPALACSSPYDYHVVTAAYDNMIELSPRRDASGAQEVAPALAERWNVSRDGKTYTFSLRRDATFASGNPVTADDVVFSLRRLLDRDGCQAYVLTMGEKGLFRSIEKVDDHTVRVRIAHSDPLFLLRMTSRGNGPIDRRLLAQHGGLSRAGDEWLARHTAGAGAYELESYDPDSEVRLRARPNYWREPVGAKNVVMRIVTDPTTLQTLTASGDVDLAYGVGLKDLRSLEQQGRQIFANASNRYAYIGLNNDKPPVDDARVREALWLAMPHAELQERFGYGYARAFAGMIPPAMPFYPGFAVPARDVERAKQLIQQAGATGKRISLAVKSGETEQLQMATALQSAWKEIGIDVQINTLSASAFSDTVSNFKTQAYILRDGSSVNDPAFFLGFFAMCGNPFNWSRYCDRDVDRLLDEGRTEPDQKRRAQIYREASERIVADNPILPIFASDTIAVASPRLRGYEYFDDQQLVIRKLKVDGAS